MTIERRPLRLVSVGAIIVGLFVAFLGGRFYAAGEMEVKPSAEQLNYRWVMAALDAGWRATWKSSLEPAAEWADGDQRACWRVPLYDIVSEDVPLRCQRCIDRAGEPTYTWLIGAE